VLDVDIAGLPVNAEGESRLFCLPNTKMNLGSWTALDPERKGFPMASSEILKDKLILAVDDEEDVLDIIEEEISEAANVTLHSATTFEKAQQYLVSYTYDLVILDIMGVRGFDLLQIAENANFPVVMLTAHAFTPEALKKSIQLGARAYLPKEKLGSLVPFLEDVLKLNYQSAWSKALDQVGSLFNRKFGSDWRKSEETFWEDFEKKLSIDEATIIK
jgi:CheY-like chemotaxis protein